MAGVEYAPGISIHALLALAWRHGIKVECHVCGGRIAEKHLSLPPNHKLYPTHEHIVPISKGGAHTLENAAISHRWCNSKKNAREPVQGDLLANAGRTPLTVLGRAAKWFEENADEMSKVQA